MDSDKYLIANTTKEERIALIKSWIPEDDAMEDCDIDLWDMYADYINGKKEIAECNFDQPFTTELGETSPMIETPTSLRYVRVLEVIPPEQSGGDEQLKVAQILFTKRELDGIPTEAEMEQKLKYNYQDSYLAQKLNELLDKYEFTCPLFPNIRDEWPVAKTKTQDDVPQE